MEIIKEGLFHTPEPWSEEAMCNAKDKHDKSGCSAVLKIAAADLVLMYWKGSHYDHYYTGVQCPCCLKFNRVNPPESVWRPLHTKENQAKALFDGFSDR